MQGMTRQEQDQLLWIYADNVNDIEATRIAMKNRVRSLLSEEEWGKNLNPNLPEVQLIQNQLDALKALEEMGIKALERAMKSHYLGPWCKRTVGVGNKQLGRLVAAIGDPATRTMPSQLWSYCGVGDAKRQVRRKGQQANWNAEAKMRVYLIAASCVKARTSPYRKVYEEGRARYAEAVHTDACVRCGPKGKPAAAGSLLSNGHQHGRAMRLVMKEVLKDLWLECRSHTTQTEETEFDQEAA